MGIANFEQDRWDIEALSFGVGNNPATVNIADRIAGDGTVLIAVISYYALGGTLERMSFGAYDEVEDNDTPETANSLPGINFSGFVGNCGNLDGAPGYDGDGEDGSR